MMVSKLSFLLAVNICLSHAFENLVYGGKESNPPRKYLVNLAINEKSKHFGCSGSIITSSWIISAAHCFPEPAETTVKVYHMTEVIADVQGDNIVLNPKYEFLIDDHLCTHSGVDMALLRTQEPIAFNKHINYISLSRTVPKFGHSAIVAGYGRNDVKALATEGLVYIIYCDELPGAICTDAIARSAPGDSGGALERLGKLVGVNSCSCDDWEDTSRKCESTYASVPVNMDWILNTIED